MGIAVALLARSTTDGSYVTAVLPAAVVFGLGLAVTVAPWTATVLGAVPAEHAGLASAVNNDVARLGSLIAVAVLPALAGITGSSYLHSDELSSGFRTAVLTSAALCVAGGLLAAVGVRSSSRVEVTPPGVAPGSEPIECFTCALDSSPPAVQVPGPSSTAPARVTTQP